MRLLSKSWGIDTEVLWSETAHMFCKHISLLPFGCAWGELSCVFAVIPEDPVSQEQL